MAIVNRSARNREMPRIPQRQTWPVRCPV